MSGFAIEVIAVTEYVQNCMLVSSGDGDRAVLIDPGGDVDRIHGAIERKGAQVEGILVTHGHIDHIGGLEEAVALTGAPVWFHPDDRWLFEDPTMGYGRIPSIPIPDDATELTDGDKVEVAGLTFTVLHTPGHSPGHVCFLLDIREGTLLFGGDLIFSGSIGRTDLPGGDFDTLVRSVADKIWPLPDETYVLPGHGPSTTVGHEKQTNPFVGLQVIEGRR